MNGREWTQLQHIIQNFCAVFSILINSFLIFLIIKKSPIQLGTYKYLMGCISVFEIIYSITDILLYPVFFSFKSYPGLLTETRDRTFMTPQLLRVFSSIFCGFFVFSQIMYTIHFIYRYFVAIGSKWLKTFSTRLHLFFWLMIPTTLSTIWTVVALLFFQPTKIMDEAVENLILISMDLKVNEYTYIGPLFYIGDEINWPPFVAMASLMVFLMCLLCFVIYLSMKSIRKINAMIDKAQNSTNSRVLQSQLFYALVAQTLIPAILMHFPIMAILALSMLEKDMGRLSGIVAMTLALYPAIDPLPTLFLVKNYRRAMFEYFKSIAKKLDILGLKSSQIVETNSRQREPTVSS